MTTLSESFSEIIDNRGRSGRIFSLNSLLLLTLLAMISGCDTQAAIYRFGQRLNKEQRLSLGFLWFRMPSHATICLFFQTLNVDALEQCLSRIMIGVRSENDDRLHLAIDGKTLRGSVCEARPNGMHLLAIFADKLQSVVAQHAGKRGYNEVTTAIEMLRDMPLDGAIITGDAMFADRAFCHMVRAQGGEYILPVKNNQPSLKKAIKTAVNEKKTLENA